MKGGKEYVKVKKWEGGRHFHMWRSDYFCNDDVFEEFIDVVYMTLHCIPQILTKEKPVWNVDKILDPIFCTLNYRSHLRSWVFQEGRATICSLFDTNVAQHSAELFIFWIMKSFCWQEITYLFGLHYFFKQHPSQI